MFLVTLVTCHLDKRDKQLTMDQLVRLSSRSSHLGTIAWSTTFLVTFTLERDRAFSKYTLKHSFNTDIHTSSGNGSSSSKHSLMTTSTLQTVQNMSFLNNYPPMTGASRWLPPDTTTSMPRRRVESSSCRFLSR